MLNRLELLLFGWTPILLGLALILVGHLFKRARIAVVGLAFTFPFSLQTTIWGLPLIGLFAWLLAAIGVYALSEREYFWSRVLCVPLFALVGYVAVAVFSFLQII